MTRITKEWPKWKQILLWPSAPNNHKSAWFAVAWRALWWPVMYLGFTLALIGGCMAYGPKSALSLWKSGYK